MQTKGRRQSPIHFSSLLRYGVLPPIAIGLVVALRVFLLVPLKLESESMYPTIAPDSWVLALRYKSPKLGDLVLYRSPSTQTTQIARLVGLSGDSLRMHNDSLYVAGKLLHTYPKGSTTDYKLYIPRRGESLHIEPTSLITYRPLIAQSYQTSIDSIQWTQGRLWIGNRATDAVQLSDNYCWLLVDQPEQGTDSRSLGLISRDAIIAVVLFHL